MGELLETDRHTRSAALLIEADEAYEAAITACLRLAGCDVSAIMSPAFAGTALNRKAYDLIVWGAGSEDDSRHGQVIAELRLQSDAPLILIASDFETARGDLEAGVDQRLPRPFVPGALVGSIKAALRRPARRALDVADHLEIRGASFDAEGRILWSHGRHVSFTKREWDLFAILLDRRNRYVGVAEILEQGWMTGENGPVEVRIYVRRLRRKLDPMALPFTLVSTRGKGYCLNFSS